MKNKIFRVALCAVPALAALYAGICCAATAVHAATQPYLLAAGTVRHNFLGYTLIAVTYGGICFLCLLVLLLAVIGIRHFDRKHRKPSEPAQEERGAAPLGALPRDPANPF